jgi:hypothetical protein
LQVYPLEDSPGIRFYPLITITDVTHFWVIHDRCCDRTDFIARSSMDAFRLLDKSCLSTEEVPMNDELVAIIMPLRTTPLAALGTLVDKGHAFDLSNVPELVLLRDITGLNTVLRRLNRCSSTWFGRLHLRVDTGLRLRTRNSSCFGSLPLSSPLCQSTSHGFVRRRKLQHFPGWCRSFTTDRRHWTNSWNSLDRSTTFL